MSLPSGPYSQEKLANVLRQLKQMGMGTKDIYSAATEFEFLLYLSDSGKNVQTVSELMQNFTMLELPRLKAEEDKKRKLY